MGRKTEASVSKPHSPGYSLASLHDAARKGDSRSLQKLLALIDPKAAEKVAAVLLERTTRAFSSGRANASVGPRNEKVVTAFGRVHLLSTIPGGEEERREHLEIACGYSTTCSITFDAT